jgi:hypothetical protein
MGWCNHTVFQGYGKAVERSNHLTRLFQMIIKECGTRESLWEEDLCQAICLLRSVRVRQSKEVNDVLIVEQQQQICKKPWQLPKMSIFYFLFLGEYLLHLTQ